MQVVRAAQQEKVKWKAVVILQAHWRGHQIRMQQRQHKAAQLLQAIWRGHVVRKLYVPHLNTRREKREEAKHIQLIRNKNATRLQAHWRGYRLRLIYTPILRSLKEKRIEETKRKEAKKERLHNYQATILQANWKGYQVRKKYGPVLLFMKKRQMNEGIRKQNRAAAHIQAYWRRYTVRQKDRSQMMATKSEQNRIKKERAAVVLQARWKGYVVRMKYSALSKEKCNAITNSVEDEDTRRREECWDESRENMENSITLFDNTSILVNEMPASTISINQYQAKSPSSGIGKLTVTKRIQSALRMQEHKEETHTKIWRVGPAVSQKSDHSENSESADEDSRMIQPRMLEEEKMYSLMASREREERVAKQSRDRMVQVMTQMLAGKVHIYIRCICVCIAFTHYYISCTIFLSFEFYWHNSIFTQFFLGNSKYKKPGNL